MRVHIKVVDDKGTSFEGTVELVKATKSKRAAAATVAPKEDATPSLSFTLNPRAFMSRYGRKKSGRQRFTLLLARLTKGKVGQEVSVKDLTSAWNKMKPVMGGPYNGAHANRAVEKGWVDSSGKGRYALSGDWKESLVGK